MNRHVLNLFVLFFALSPLNVLADEQIIYKGWQITVPDEKDREQFKKSILAALDMIETMPEKFRAQARAIREMRYRPVKEGDPPLDGTQMQVIAFFADDGNKQQRYLRIVSQPAFVRPIDYAASIIANGYAAQHSTEGNTHEFICSRLRNSLEIDLALRHPPKTFYDLQANMMRNKKCPSIPVFPENNLWNPSQADLDRQFEVCQELLKKKEFVPAKNCLESGTVRGNSKFQTLLGNMYNAGLGAPVNKEAAVRLWKKAAETGWHAAEYNLGQAYFQGAGVARDYPQSLHYFKRASENPDYSWPQYWIGVIYEQGLGVEKDLGEARKWYKISADRGFADASKRLKELDSTQQ